MNVPQFFGIVPAALLSLGGLSGPQAIADEAPACPCPACIAAAEAAVEVADELAEEVVDDPTTGTATATASADPTEAVPLFNGTDLTGWTADLQDDRASIADVWSVEDGILKCTGRPAGVLRTEADYADYELIVEWRWPEGAGNSGVLVHCSTPREMGIWPNSLESQLGSGNAGDFWQIGVTIDVPEAQQTDGRRRPNLTDDSEHEIGEWNTMRIRCAGDDVYVWVNSVLVNAGTNASATSGAICLQSEGKPIEFRRVEIAPWAAD